MTNNNETNNNPTPIPNEQVDQNINLTPAMLTALFQRPYDRQFVIDLEVSILGFIDSNALSYELKPMNSYYRLLAHQIAEYHNLQHTLARSQDKCLIIFKGEGFKKITNKPLLQHIQPYLAGPHPPIIQMSIPPHQHFYPESPNQISNHNMNNANNNTNKKFKLLKKDQSTSSINSTDNSVDQEFENNNSVKESYNQIDQDDNSNNNSNINLEQDRTERENEYELRKKKIFEVDKTDDEDEDEDEDANESEDNDNESDLGNESNVPSTPDRTNRDEIERHSSSSYGSSGDSPQPHQFETSRYQFEQHNKSSKYNKRSNSNNYSSRGQNNHYKGYNKSHNKYGYNNLNNNSPMPFNSYNMPQMGYPTPQMHSGSGPFPMMYPGSIPIDGQNRFMQPLMYASMGAGHSNAESPMVPPYVQYPYQVQYYPFNSMPSQNMPYFQYSSVNDKDNNFYGYQQNAGVNGNNSNRKKNGNSYKSKQVTEPVSEGTRKIVSASDKESM
ncbi:hypothetical protein Kpol_1019p35, partial [Vanderwaltozyma polyspora DSM 70294]